MDEASVTRWLERYVAAWRSYEPDDIRALFSEDAVYRYHPWDEAPEAVEGREAIVASWLAEPDAPAAWEASYRPWVVEGDRAAAVGVSRYRATDVEPEAVYHNVFLLRFDEETAARSSSSSTCCARTDAQSARTCSRAAPVPTSETGTSSARETNET